MSAKNYWLAFGIGVSAGAAIALLYAPQSGARTRRQLRKGVEGAVDDASDYLHDAGDYLKAQAERLAEEAQDAVKQARKQASHIAGRAGEQASDLAESVSDIVGSAVKSAKSLV
ncbi:MAG: YtxH domain-containing protein [Acidobacteria bacterium]|nr:YtxH domain-containing protein [Acidobacteriota bacterium]